MNIIKVWNDFSMFYDNKCRYDYSEYQVQNIMPKEFELFWWFCVECSEEKRKWAILCGVFERQKKVTAFKVCSVSVDGFDVCFLVHATNGNATFQVMERFSSILQFALQILACLAMMFWLR